MTTEMCPRNSSSKCWQKILILWNIFLLPNANMQVLKEVPILLQQYVSSKMAMDAWWKWYCLMKNANNSSKAAHYHVWDRGCVCFPKREEKPSIPAPYSYLPRFRQERQMTEWPIIRTRLSTFKIGFYGQHGWRWFIILSGLCLKKENHPLFPSVLFCLKM